MKLLIISALLLFVSCDPKSKMNENGQVKAEKTQMKSDVASESESSENSGIVEENDMCICTKEFRPVCGSNGRTYPNSCMAGCEGITEYTEGNCK